MYSRKLLMIGAIALLTGCASSSGGRYADVNAVVPKLSPDRGRVYFYRSASVVGAAIQPDIKLNGETVGRAVPGGFFFIDRPKGSYEASTATEVETMLAFTLAAGETKYIRTSITPGFFAGHMQFEVVGRPVAEAELASLNQTARTDVASR